MRLDVADIYAAGVGFEVYRRRMQIHADKFGEIHESLAFVRDVEAGQAPLGASRLLVLTEDFCIDSVLNLPLLARLVEASPAAELRIASRNEHRRLANRFPGRGGVSRLPTVIVLDATGQVRGHWSERSASDHAWMAAFLESDPMPEIVLQDGRPTPVVAAWMERRFRAQRPFLLAHGWRAVRDELCAVVAGSVRAVGVA